MIFVSQAVSYKTAEQDNAEGKLKDLFEMKILSKIPTLDIDYICVCHMTLYTDMLKLLLILNFKTV